MLQLLILHVVCVYEVEILVMKFNITTCLNVRLFFKCFDKMTKKMYVIILMSVFALN